MRDLIIIALEPLCCDMAHGSRNTNDASAPFCNSTPYTWSWIILRGILCKISLFRFL